MRRDPAGLLAPVATIRLGLLLLWAAASRPAAPHAGWLLGLPAVVAVSVVGLGLLPADPRARRRGPYAS